MKLPIFLLCATVLSPAAFALKPSTQGEPYVEKVTLQWGGNAAPVVTLRNKSGSTLADSANIQPDSDTARIALTGNVKCIKDKKVNYDRARAYFGPAVMSGGSIDESQALYSASYHPSFTQWHGVGNGKWITESGNHESFNVPLGAIKNGPPNIAFDPVAEFEKRLQAHVQQGGKKIDFLKKNQEFVISRTLSLGGWCKQDGVSRSGVNSAFVNLKVRYIGDSKLAEPPQLNAQLGGNMPNQIGHNLPMQLVTASFQPNMPHYTGMCPPAEDPVIRVNYSGSGKGFVRFSIEDGSAVYGTQDIAFDASQGGAHFDFAYPLAAKLVSKPQWAEPNKTVQHTLVVRAKYRDENSNTWSAWKNYGSATWNHRCTPQVNVGVGGNASVKNAEGAGSPDNSRLEIQAPPATPAPKKLKPLEPVGVKPVPGRAGAGNVDLPDQSPGGLPPLEPGIQTPSTSKPLTPLGVRPGAGTTPGAARAPLRSSSSASAPARKQP